MSQALHSERRIRWVRIAMRTAGPVLFLLLAACGGSATDGLADGGHAADGGGEDAGGSDAAAMTDVGEPSEARILSAYHGLDELPMLANFLCGTNVAGQDGMPVVFSMQLTEDSLTPEAFRVETAEGASVTPTCATLGPALEERERRTVLLTGPFGTSASPPRAVEVVGPLQDAAGRSVTGARTESIVPLAGGPSLVLAERFDAGTSGFEGECPADAAIVQLIFDGGVSGPDGSDLGDGARTAVAVTLEGGAVVTPVALGDDDPDNHVVACLDDDRLAVSVSVAAGFFHDPGDDPNPETTIAVVDGSP